MTIRTFYVGAAVTPTVVRTYISHYSNRKPRHQKPTAHISYDEGLNLIRSFLDYASHRTVEELQAFTAQWVPHPRWVRTENAVVPAPQLAAAAAAITTQLGPSGVAKVGGTRWWQWRSPGKDLAAEWIEMRADYNDHKKANGRSTRVMMYIHGGAYFFGSVDEHRYQMQRHARKLKARVFAPRYRLAPQFPFPCGLQDCLAAYLYLLTFQDPTEIILAGDSAGAGMIVSILCILRDQNLPLPAGAVLISPWVDLTHSFPSLGGSAEFDYIPPHGFMQKPSTAWPPPNDDEMEAVAAGTVSKRTGNVESFSAAPQEKAIRDKEAVQGFAVVSPADTKPEYRASTNPTAPKANAQQPIPGPGHQLSIELDGKLVVLKDQIQMYTTNQLLSHPLVSPIVQPSLGGLPPLLILTGGGEMLRDEQIYLAHKAANPSKYPLGEEYRKMYDPDNQILNRFRPTPVQLQVWEDLCHVAPTLSFTRPAKYMYRSVSQFAAWALARAQKTSIEIVDDDNISVISSGSDTGPDNITDGVMHQHQQGPAIVEPTSESVGRAGDPLPPFQNHMIRQRVDRHGQIYPLEPAHELPALQMTPSAVGVIKPGPVLKWMRAKREWDTRYARVKRNVQRRRLRELASGNLHGFGENEQPPPSALASRRRVAPSEIQTKRKSYGLAMWSLWGSKHDEQALKREKDAVEAERKESRGSTSTGQAVEEKAGIDGSVLLRSTDATEGTALSRRGSRRRTISVKDAGQTEGLAETTTPSIAVSGVTGDETAEQQAGPSAPTPPSTPQPVLTPFYLPKFKKAAHLQPDARVDDASSIRTGESSRLGTPENASTTAVFAAPGVLPDPLSAGDLKDAGGGPGSGFSSGYASGYDTPRSRRSLDRLLSHQEEFDEHYYSPEAQKLRSPSAVAVVQAEGVVDPVEAGAGGAGQT